MAKVDDLLEKRAKQVVLAIVARLAHWSPRQRISPSKESRIPQIGNPKPQENPHAHPAFLQNRLLAQVKSSRSINRFRILHGRRCSAAACCVRPRPNVKIRSTMPGCTASAKSYSQITPRSCRDAAQQWVVGVFIPVGAWRHGMVCKP